jgi:hypothetical protein
MDEEHRRLGEEYRKLVTQTARKTFVKDHATRYMQLSRLPYFNLVDQIVIDPMHNLFLGMCHSLSMCLALISFRSCQDTFLQNMGPTEDPSPQSRT